MADLASDADLGRLLIAADERGQIFAPLCHGAAALLSASRAAGRHRRAHPWFVESRLGELGADVATGPAWSSTAVVDTISSAPRTRSRAPKPPTGWSPR